MSSGANETFLNVILSNPAIVVSAILFVVSTVGLILLRKKIRTAIKGIFITVIVVTAMHLTLIFWLSYSVAKNAKAPM